MKKYILTNNPFVKDKFKHSSEYLDCDFLTFLYKLRDKIHLGDRLLTSVLYGSIKSRETPYRSVILECGDTLSLESLQLIEEAIILIKNQPRIKKEDLPPKIDLDFQWIDYELLLEMIRSLRISF